MWHLKLHDLLIGNSNTDILFSIIIYIYYIRLECPPHTVRLISSDDVLASIPGGFASIITTSTVFESDSFVGFEDSEFPLPNFGRLTFNHNFLLVGFTVAGYDTSRFISNFRFQYSTASADLEQYNEYQQVSCVHAVIHYTWLPYSASI